MTSDEHTSTLLGASHGPLELRVVSSQLAGQTVRLNSAKCTIGSGSRCTLCLQARRVEPVHCLILRGENGTVIRRWSPHTRLNGATFTDALLQPGDRLTIGPIELDVISTGQKVVSSNASESASALAAPSQAAQEIGLAANPQLLAELEQREAALQAREEELSEQLAALATQKSEWEKTQAGNEAEFAARREEHQTLTHELNNLRQLQQDLPDLLEDRQQYDERRSQLVSAEKELAAAQALFEAECAAQAATLTERQSELDKQSAALEEARQQLAAERAELEQKQQAAETSFHEREAELNRRFAELEAARAESERTTAEQAKDLHQREQVWQESQAAWAAERAVWNTTCHETSTEFQRQQAELDHQRKEFAAEQEEFAKRREAREAAQAALAAEREEFADSEEPTELEHKESQAAATLKIAEPQSFEHSSLATLFDAEKEEACDDDAFESPSPGEYLSQGTADTAASGDHLHLHEETTEAEETESEEPAWSDEERGLSLAERLLGKHLPAESTGEEETEHEPESRGEVAEEEDASTSPEMEDSYNAAEEAPAFEEPVKASPAESSGLMERLRAMTPWEDEDDEQQSSNHGTSTPGRSSSESLNPLASKTETGSRSSSGGAAGNSDDDEESIEDYMAKLMSRVRGDSAPLAPVPMPPRVVPQPQPVDEPEPEDNLGEQNTTVSASAEPFAMSPRHVPTELTSNLAAMRELANFSARDAIDTSVRNRWWQAAIGKFSVAVIAILSAGVLLYWTKDAFSIQFLGAGIALLVAVFWGLQGAIIMRNVRKANQILEEKAKEPEVEAAQMREMLYAETEDLQFDLNKRMETPSALASSAIAPTGDVVEIENGVDSEDANVQ